MYCKPSSRISHDSHSWGFKICVQHCETNDKIMSWQRCLFLRPFRFILRALRNRNSSQLAALSVHAVCAGWRRRTAGRHELFFSPILARFSPAQQSLSIPLFAIVMGESASNLPASAQHQRRTLLLRLLLITCAWRVLRAFSVPVLLAGFIPSRFLIDRSLLIPV